MSRARSVAKTNEGPASQAADISGSSRQPPIPEHAIATLSRALKLEDGRTLPRGARGAVVFVHGNGAAYLVEFAKPFHAVATVPAGYLSQSFEA